MDKLVSKIAALGITAIGATGLLGEAALQQHWRL